MDREQNRCTVRSDEGDGGDEPDASAPNVPDEADSAADSTEQPDRTDHPPSTDAATTPVDAGVRASVDARSALEDAGETGAPSGEAGPEDVGTGQIPALPTWEPVEGRAAEIAVGANGDVWIIDKMPNWIVGTVYKRTQSSWQVVASRPAERIAVSPDGVPWIIATTQAPGGGLDRKLYKGSDNSADPQWELTAADCVLNVSIGAAGDVWFVGCDANSLSKREGAMSRHAGEVPAPTQEFAVGPDGVPWIADIGDRVFQRKSGNPTDPSKWTLLHGTGGRAISVSPTGRVFIIGDFSLGGETFYGYQAKYLTTEGAWVPLDGTQQGVRIAAGPEHVWMVDGQHQIFRMETAGLE